MEIREKYWKFFNNFLKLVKWIWRTFFIKIQKWPTPGSDPIRTWLEPTSWQLPTLGETHCFNQSTIILQAIISSWYLFIESQQWKQQHNVWTLFKVKKRPDWLSWRTSALVSLSLTLSMFHRFLWCFHCWLWASKCRQGKEYAKIVWVE